MSVGVVLVFVVGIAIGVGVALYFSGTDRSANETASADHPDPVDASGELEAEATEMPEQSGGDVDLASLMGEDSKISAERWEQSGKKESSRADESPAAGTDSAGRDEPSTAGGGQRGQSTSLADAPIDEQTAEGIRGRPAGGAGKESVDEDFGSPALSEAERSNDHWLEGLNGSVEDKTYRLAKPLSIGRHERNDIQVREGDVSRVHCRLRPQQDAVVLEVLDTVNGTRVNGQEVEPGSPRKLGHEDIVEIGNLLFMFYEEGSFDRDASGDGGATSLTSDVATVMVDSGGWRERIEQEMEMVGGDKQAAAESLGLEESDLERIVRNLEIE
jgi:hypothetical protein